MLWEVVVRVTAAEVGKGEDCVRLLERGCEVGTEVDVWKVDRERLEAAAEAELQGLLGVVKGYLQ